MNWADFWFASEMSLLWFSILRDDEKDPVHEEKEIFTYLAKKLACQASGALTN